MKKSGNAGVFDKTKLEKQILTNAERLYIYVFGVQPVNFYNSKDRSFDKSLSLDSLLVFDSIFQDLYGPMLKRLPSYIPPYNETEYVERTTLIKNMYKIMIETEETWKKIFAKFIPESINKTSRRHNFHTALVNIEFFVRCVFSTEEIRRMHSNALKSQNDLLNVLNSITVDSSFLKLANLVESDIDSTVVISEEQNSAQFHKTGEGPSDGNE